MLDAFLNRLKQRGLREDDACLVADNCVYQPDIAAQVDICSGDASSPQIHIIEEGWACRYRLMTDGRRQIVSIHLPGDVCDLDKLFHDTVPYDISAITRCRVATLSVDWVRSACSNRPSFRDALWHVTVDNNAKYSEQIVSLGRRTARERMAFFLCELLARLEQLGLAPAQSFRSPLTQSDIADLIGLSTVHVNRTLQHLRDEGLIKTRGRTYAVVKRDALERVAEYWSASHEVALPPVAIASPTWRHVKEQA